MAKAKQKPTTKTVPPAANKQTRQLKQAEYKSFRLQKRIKHTRPKLPTTKALTQQTIQLMVQNKRYFVWLVALYGTISYIFVQSAATAINLPELREIVSEGLGGNSVTTSISLYGVLVGASTQVDSQIVAFYQFIIVFLFSLAVIYGLRHMYGSRTKKVTVKESLYKGMTPLIPVLLVLVVLVLEFLPLSLGSSIYATVVGSGLAVTAIERVFWVLFVALLGLASLYLISSSLFALYIVTLPDMTPLAALRASRELVRFRRLAVIRKIIFMPILLFIGLGVIIIPLIAVLPIVAQFVFYVASALVLPILHTYFYNLYRSML